MNKCKSGLHEYEPVKGIGCPKCKQITRKRYLENLKNTEEGRKKLTAINNKKHSKQSKKGIKVLSDLYLSKLARAWLLKQGIDLRRSEIPKELLDAKRKQLMVKRLVLEMTNEITE